MRQYAVVVHDWAVLMLVQKIIIADDVPTQKDNGIRHVITLKMRRFFYDIIGKIRDTCKFRTYCGRLSSAVRARPVHLRTRVRFPERSPLDFFNPFSFQKLCGKIPLSFRAQIIRKVTDPSLMGV